MPIKQVFESAPGVYRTGLRSGLPDAWAGTADASRVYDEYIWFIQGLAIIENPESPTDYEIIAFVLNHERSAGLLEGANTVVMRWSGLTGEFLGHDGRYSTTSLLGFQQMVTGADGKNRAKWYGLTGGTAAIYKFDPSTYDFAVVQPPNHYDSYASSDAAAYTPCVDEAADIALMINESDHHDLREIAVHRESTGEFLYKFPVNGVPQRIFMTEDRRAYTVADDGILTLFDYTTGQVLSVLDVGITVNDRHWTWDRVSKRILSIERTPDTMPEGHCTCQVRGYYPVPVAHGLAGPIPLQAPAVGRRVEWVSKVYGAAGEGIPGALVSYSLESALGVTLSPAQHATDLNGNSRTFVTSSLAGDNTLTASVEVPAP